MGRNTWDIKTYLEISKRINFLQNTICMYTYFYNSYTCKVVNRVEQHFQSIHLILLYRDFSTIDVGRIDSQCNLLTVKFKNKFLTLIPSLFLSPLPLFNLPTPTVWFVYNCVYFQPIKLYDCSQSLLLFVQSSLSTFSISIIFALLKISLPLFLQF